MDNALQENSLDDQRHEMAPATATLPHSALKQDRLCRNAAGWQEDECPESSQKQIGPRPQLRPEFAVVKPVKPFCGTL